MRKSIALPAGLLLSLIIPLLPAAAFAATTTSGGTSLTTYPVSTVVHAEPGHSTTTTIGVENDSLTPYGVQLQVQTFKPYGESGQAQIMKPKTGSPFVNWIHFSQSSFVAQPSVMNKITVTIDPPSTAALDYYYAVIVKPVALSSTAKKLVAFNGYNAILVLLDVTSPNAKAQLTVNSFTTNHGLYEYLPATFNITVHNTGNVFLAPQGNVLISRNSSFQKIIDTVPINAPQGNVIPGSKRIYSQQWTDGFPDFVPNKVDGQTETDGKGNPIEHLNWDFSQTNKLRFGKYYAKMIFVYNNGTTDVPIQAVVSFWVIPWKVLTVVIILVILCVVGLYVSGHRLADRTFKALKPTKVRLR